MSKYKKELVGIPALQMAESPSSWLSRLALRQGISLSELLKYFELPLKGDTDIAFVRGNMRRIAGLCGLPHKDFHLIRKMFLGVASLDRKGAKYLFSHEGAPRYRFCPSCLFGQREKHLPLHWRFKAWRWCPEHYCLLEDACPHCASPVLLPADMISGGPDRAGVGMLNRCLRCAGKLCVAHTSTNGTLDFLLLAPWEALLLKNGRALLAALYLREVKLDFTHGSFSLGAIRRIEKQGLLPHDHFRLTSAEVVRRKTAYDEKPPIRATVDDIGNY